MLNESWCFMSSKKKIIYLDWDSLHFKRKIAMLMERDRIEWQEVDDYADRNRIDCIYFFCSSSNFTNILQSQAHGFRYMDTRITFSKTINKNTFKNGHEKVYVAQPDELPEIFSLVFYNHRNTRFFIDNNFSTNDSLRMYQLWLEKDLTRQSLYVTKNRLGKISGYVSFLIENNKASLGLIGVASRFKKQGLGESLLSQVEISAFEKSCKQLVIATQANNIPAVRLYEKQGYRLVESGIWFHKWYRNRENKF